MFEHDLSQPDIFLWTVAAFGSVVILRYLLVAGTFYLVFYAWKPQRWKNRQIEIKKHATNQYRREIGWSLLTSFIFGLSGVLIMWGWQQGYLKIYLNPAQYGIWYLPGSVILAMLVQETYYYWVHRLMHHRAVYRHVHRVHHNSHIVSPWTSFSFHPLESLLQAIIFPVTLLFLPMHPYAIVAFLTIMTIASTVNHLNVEIYPAGFDRHWLGRWLIGATHHSLHHQQFNYNYGLYFTFWDKWMRTESPLFHSLFRKTSGKP